MTRYIFLDFDGVISTDRNNLGRKDLGLQVRDELGPFFDANAVDNLNRIVDATDADIIITSSWKYLGFDAMRELWERRSMPGFLRGITPDVTGGYMFKRGMEIARWLHDNTCDDPQSYRYVIVDDGEATSLGQLLSVTDLQRVMLFRTVEDGVAVRSDKVGRSIMLLGKSQHLFA